MEETLLQAENKFLKARVEFLELKLSSLSQKEQKGEYLDLHQLNMKQLFDVGMQLGRRFNSGWDKHNRILELRHFYGMAKVLKVVKDMQSRGLHKDISIFNIDTN